MREYGVLVVLVTERRIRLVDGARKTQANLW
jgi:hypothetical protein